MEKNIDIKEQEAMGQVKELEKLYERKIALTTNKLLTEKEISFRDKTTSENRLKLLEKKHYDSIEEIRKEFSEYIKRTYQDQDQAQHQMITLKKEYECRLLDLEQEN